MTGYHDYLIILSPPENIGAYVNSLKKKASSVIGDFESLHSKAHITVQAWPRKKPVWVEPLIPKLERDLLALPPLVTHIEGFSYFDHQEYKTIYARLNPSRQMQQWFKLLRRFFHTPTFEPHITVARNIGNEDFKKLWPYFRDEPFSTRMEIYKLTVLRRETIGYNKTFKIIREMPFNSALDFDSFMNAKLKRPALPSNKSDVQQFSLF